MSWTGLDQLDELERFLRELGSTATIGAAPAAAAGVGAAAAAQYAAGSGPDGPWPRNKDGSIPLQGPAREIHFAARGSAVVATAPDVLRYHAERRPVFPAGESPPAAWSSPIEAAVLKAVDASAPER